MPYKCTALYMHHYKWQCTIMLHALYTLVAAIILAHSLHIATCMYTLFLYYMYTSYNDMHVYLLKASRGVGKHS